MSLTRRLAHRPTSAASHPIVSCDRLTRRLAQLVQELTYLYKGFLPRFFWWEVISILKRRATLPWWCDGPHGGVSCLCGDVAGDEHA